MPKMQPFWWFLKPKIICPEGEQIINGGFESDLSVGWNATVPPELNPTYPWNRTTFPHSGFYSAKSDWPRGCLAQDFSSPIPFSCVKTWGCWYYYTGPIPRVYLFFTDGTYVYRNLGKGVTPLFQWNYEDWFVDVWTGQDESVYKTKSIAKIVLYTYWVASGECYVDDVSLVGTG